MQDSLRCDDVVVTASERAGRGPHKGGRTIMSFVLHWTQSLTRRTAGVMTTAVAMATIATAIGGPIPAAAPGAVRGPGGLPPGSGAQFLHPPGTRAAPSQRQRRVLPAAMAISLVTAPRICCPSPRKEPRFPTSQGGPPV